MSMENPASWNHPNSVGPALLVNAIDASAAWGMDYPVPVNLPQPPLFNTGGSGTPSTPSPLLPGPSPSSPPHDPLPEWVQSDLRQMGELVANVMMARSEFLSRGADPRRDIGLECGHPVGPQTVDFYYNLWRRNSIARRVVSVFSSQCWQVSPRVFETVRTDRESAFEKRFQQVASGLCGGSDNWYQDEGAIGLWGPCKQVDEESGIGGFGLLYLGLDDGLNPDQPARFYRKGETRPSTPTNLLYLTVYSEAHVEIESLETNKQSERYGQPVMYRIKYRDPTDLAPGSPAIVGQPVTEELGEQRVHWTRVIHVKDRGGNKTHAPPRMESVLYEILDVYKVGASSAEMFYLAAMPGWSLETQPELSGARVKFDEQKTKDQIEQYRHGLQRWLLLKGLTAKSLSPQVSDPTPILNQTIQRICICLDIPKRVFTGSEQGEQSSLDDRKSWNRRVRGGQDNHCTADIILPLVNRMILVNVCPEPEGYSVWWPDLTAGTDQEKADILLKRMQAMAQWKTGKLYEHLSFRDYLVEYEGMTPEEADYLEENGRAERAREEREMMRRQRLMIESGLAPDPNKPPPGRPGAGGPGGVSGTGTVGGGTARRATGANGSTRTPERDRGRPRRGSSAPSANGSS